MADLSNPQLVHFCNEDVRQLADRLAALDVALTPFLETYNARDLGTIIEAGGAGNLIDDGSEQDGRTRVVGGDVYNFVTLIQDLQTFITTGRRDVIYRWQVNGV